MSHRIQAFRKSFLPLKYPDFGKLLFGQFISNIGSQFSYIALQFLIFDLTGEIAAMAILAIAEVIPMIIIGPFAGVVIDRYDRKYIMAVANLSQALIIFMIPVTVIFSSTDRIIAIIILAFLNSTFNRFFFPARGASIPKLIDNTDDLFGANSLSAGAYQTSALIGPMLAGLIIGLYGYDIPFIIDGLTFIISSICILWISKSLKPIDMKKKQSPIQDLITGGRFIINFQPMFYILLLFSFLMFAGGGALFLLIPFLELEFGLTVRGQRELIYGIMIAMSAGVGMIFALFLSKKKNLAKPITMMTYSLIIAGFIFIGFGLAPNIPILALAFIGFGTIQVVVGIPLQTITQETVPDNLRGKVFSFINLAISTSQIIGMGIVSILAYFLALRGTFIFNGLLMIIFSFIGFYWLKKKSLEKIAKVRRQEFHKTSESDL